MTSKKTTPAPVYMRRGDDFVQVLGTLDTSRTKARYTRIQHLSDGRVGTLKTSYFRKGFTRTTPQAAKAHAAN